MYKSDYNIKRYCLSHVGTSVVSPKQHQQKKNTKISFIAYMYQVYNFFRRQMKLEIHTNTHLRDIGSFV